MLPGRGDNRLKCRKPLDIDQSLNYRLAISIQNRLCALSLSFVKLPPFWIGRHFGLVAILEYPPFWIRCYIEFTIIIQFSIQFNAIKSLLVTVLYS